MKKRVAVMILASLIAVTGCRHQANQVESAVVGEYFIMDSHSVMELTESMTYIREGDPAGRYELLPGNEMILHTAEEEISYSYALEAPYLRLHGEGEGEVLLWMKGYYQGEITAKADGQLTVEIEQPFEETVSFDLEDIADLGKGIEGGDLTIGSGVLYQTINNQVIKILKVKDHAVQEEVISQLIEDNDAHQCSALPYECCVDEHQSFFLNVEPVKETEHWRLSSGPGEGVAYMGHSKERWLFRGDQRGEYIMTFEKVDDSTAEVIETVNMQVFVENQLTRPDSVFEVKGVIMESFDRHLTIESESGTYRLYVPDGFDVEGIVRGERMILGVGVGEASYLLRYMAADDPVVDQASGLNIIRHIGRIERIDEERLRLIVNEYVLEIYHNDRIDSSDPVDDLVYVEYVANYESESNELIFIQKVE